MAKIKQLVCLDDVCNDILKDENNKSEYIRKAIKFFNKKETPAPEEAPENLPTLKTKAEVNWH